jgi:DNA helicase-2/ATP-dependent DNA helicase PcrA
MLRRFHAEEAKQPWRPIAVEEEFVFLLERNRVSGRYDLVLEQAGETTIVDFKTGEVREPKAAERRARESLQLDIYALAHLRTKGRLPDRVELRFLETGLVGSRRPTPQEATATETRIRAAASAIRKREFPARPTFFACSQCPFREICPHTAWGEPEE